MGFADRAASKEATVLQLARDFNGRVKPTFAECWKHILWALDVLIQMLDTSPEERLKEINKKRRNGTLNKKQKGGLSVKFQMAINAIVGKLTSVPDGNGAARGYNKFAAVLKKYLTGIVVPAIKSKQGVGRLKEFVRRWENHKIFSEYARRLFILIDQQAGTPSNGYCSGDTITALCVRQFAENLWESSKSEIVATMMAMIHTHRRDALSMEEIKFLGECKEILCVMGITTDKNFPGIKRLVNIAKANGGQFIVEEVLEVVEGTGNSQSHDGADKETVRVGDHLEFYKDEFEEVFIAASEAYFVRLRSDWLATKTVPEYLQLFEEVYKKENDMVTNQRFIHVSTQKRLQKKCIEVLLSVPQEQLLANSDTGLLALLKLDKLEECARVNRTFKLVNMASEGPYADILPAKLEGGLDQVANMFQTHIEQEGLALIAERKKRLATRLEKIKAWEKKNKKKLGGKNGERDPKSDRTLYVDKLRILHAKMKAIRVNQFENDARFTKAMTKALQATVNHNWGREARQTDEFLVNYMDMVFRGRDVSAKKISSEQIKDLCGQILELFDRLQSRDRFLDTYKRMLMERLLDTGYREYTNEGDVLSKLKLRMGNVETDTMEYMLSDITKVKESTRKWHNYLSENKGKVDQACKAFEPKILNRVAWTLPKAQIKLTQVPWKVSKWIESFQTYYSGVQSSRTLKYRHDLSLVEVNGTWGKKKYRINMTAPQACLLMLFNKEKKLTIPKMQELMQIREAHHIEQILMSLLMKANPAANAGLVYKMEKPAMPLKNTDTFVLHPKFACKKAKFQVREPFFGKVPPPPAPPRHYRLEAALVRTMKANKVMDTRDLIDESINQVRKVFAADVKQVKRCLEKLIARKYMERREGEGTKIFYKA